MLFGNYVVHPIFSLALLFPKRKHTVGKLLAKKSSLEDRIEDQLNLHKYKMTADRQCPNILNFKISASSLLIDVVESDKRLDIYIPKQEIESELVYGLNVVNI